MKNAAIIGKILLQGKLILDSPLIIGSEETGNSVDITVLKDHQGRPYIPATSLTGVMRHFFFESFVPNMQDKEKQEQINMFWGYENRQNKDNCFQSALAISDSFLSPQENPIIRVRDGVKLDSYLGIAEDKCKFDYEVVEPGITFDLKMEITLREANREHKEVYLEILALLAEAMEQGEITLGRMTTKGFGRFRLVDTSWYQYDFTQVANVFAWLNRDLEQVKKTSIKPSDMFTKKGRSLEIKAHFSIKNSLIIRSYSGTPEEPDAVHITSAGKTILPGTSVKGAVRNRALEIINVLGGNGEKMTKSLFGWADTECSENKGKTKQKSRLIVRETEINNTISMVQNRIKIDRFTGGTITGALFNTMPLWPGDDKKAMVTIEMLVPDFEEWEAGLLLLIVKDLWTGDLPLGGEKNVGRGVLQGISVEIRVDKNIIAISETPNGNLSVGGAADMLEGLVTSLAAKCQAEGGCS
ncbi:RAMP superfamily CRISPR-associated protein [Dehalobacterium formicoaceticum]|uniref:RAMP superfamily CRISPR-associated protein n=1 Tax=Dehalobacterium formicoaceticum TaxID=51515 RepID=A0ABT1YAC3_9FIRM|nr:RAMP superfamily CRISPR-associated protein [Dehalobacterium formicoaceticum]MCR6546879.1 RAMP superfamily CRISPR-associated protein [Dehalobacterium formicoaceticum]